MKVLIFFALFLFSTDTICQVDTIFIEQMQPNTRRDYQKKYIDSIDFVLIYEYSYSIRRGKKDKIVKDTANVHEYYDSNGTKRSTTKFWRNGKKRENYYYRSSDRYRVHKRWDQNEHLIHLSIDSLGENPRRTSYYPNGNIKSRQIKGGFNYYSSWYENGNPKESSFAYKDSTVLVFLNKSGLKIAQRIIVPGWIKTRGWNDDGELIYEAKKGRSERDFYRPGVLLIRKRQVKKTVKSHPELKDWFDGY